MPQERPPTNPAGEPSDPWLYGIAGMGLGLRVAEFTARRALWLDEATVADSVLSLGFPSLLGPLKHQQGAPFGFVALAKVSTLLFGPGEGALRLPSLLCGALSCLVFAVAAARCLSRPLARLTTLLFACSPWAIYYSNELKPYAFDVAGVLLLAVLATKTPETTARDRLAAILAGCILPWFSVGAVWGLAGFGLVLVREAVRSRAAPSSESRTGTPSPLRWTASTLTAWGVSLAFAYALNLRHFAGKRSEVYWASCFMPSGQPDWRAPFEWLARGFPGPECAGKIMATGHTDLLIWFAIAGLVAASPRPWGLYWCGVVGAALAGAASGVYALSHRLALFLLPGVVLGLGLGIDRLSRGRTWRAVVLSTLLLVAFAPQISARLQRRAAVARTHGMPLLLLEKLSQVVGPDDVVWWEGHSTATATYYLPRFPGFTPEHRPHRVFWDKPPASLKLSGHRLWVVNLHRWPGTDKNVLTVESKLAGEGGMPLMRLEAEASEAVIWEAANPSGPTRR